MKIAFLSFEELKEIMEAKVLLELNVIANSQFPPTRYFQYKIFVLTRREKRDNFFRKPF